MLIRVDFWHLRSGGGIAPAGFWEFGSGGCAITVLVWLRFFGSGTRVVHNDVSRHTCLRSRTSCLVLAMGPGNPQAVRFLAGGSVRFGSRTGQKPEPHCLGGFVTRTGHKPPVLAGLYPPHGSSFRVPATLAPIKYLSSDRIVACSRPRLSSLTCSFTSRIQIRDWTNIR